MTKSNVTPQEFKRLKEHVTACLIQILIEERGCSEAQKMAQLRYKTYIRKAAENWED
jgi:hypothetical protein